MALKGQLSKASLERRRLLSKPRFCICGCDERLVVRPYMFYPSSKVSVYKRGHVDTTGLCGHLQTLETRKKIGLGSKKYWEDKKHSLRRVAEIARVNRLPWKRKASASSALNLNRNKRISETMLKQYASGERQPVHGWKHFKGGWLKTKKAGEVFCSSSWETKRCKVLDKDADVISFTKNEARVPYEFEGRMHTYIPDFIVKRASGKVFVEEVKGRIFNEKEWVAKQQAVKKYCKKHKMKFSVLGSLFFVKRKGEPKFSTQ